MSAPPLAPKRHKSTTASYYPAIEPLVTACITSFVGTINTQFALVPKNKADRARVANGEGFTYDVRDLDVVDWSQTPKGTVYASLRVHSYHGPGPLIQHTAHPSWDDVGDVIEVCFKEATGFIRATKANLALIEGDVADALSRLDALSDCLDDPTGVAPILSSSAVTPAMVNFKIIRKVFVDEDTISSFPR